MKLDLNSFGKKLKLSKRVKKVKVLTEKEMFVDLLSRIEECWTRSNSLYDKFKTNLLEYEEDFFLIIEDLLLLKFGEWKTELMLWYIYGRLNDHNSSNIDKIVPELIVYVNYSEQVENLLKFC